MRIIFVTILLFALFVAPGQKTIDLEKINIEDGLSQSVVNDVLIDSKGFLWVGTQNGLNRYDGYNFKVFNNFPEDGYSLSSGFVTSLAEDANDNLWVGTRTGLNKYESRKQRFLHYGLPSNKIVFPEINIRSLLVDSENFVWVLLPNYLVRINPVEESVKIFAFGHEEDEFRHCFPTSLYENASGNIWFVKGTQIVMFDKVFEKFEFFDVDMPEDMLCLSNVFEYQNHLYVTTDHRLWKLNTGFVPKLIKTFNSRIDVIKNEHKSPILLVDNFGVYQFNGEAIGKSFAFGKPEKEFERFFVSTSTMDNNKNIWLGTSGKGLVKANIAPGKFKVIHRQVAKGEFLTDDQVSSVLVEDELFWISTYEFGLNIVNTNKNTVKQVRAREKGVLTNDNVYDIKKIGDRYVVSTELGIIILRKQRNGKLTREKHKILSEINTQIYEVLPYNEQEFFFSFLGQLCKYNIDKKEITKWMFDIEKEAGIANSYCIEEIEKSLIFIGTSHGLFRFDLRNQIWDRFLFDQSDSLAISSNDVYALNYDSLGRLWVGTANGLDLVNDPFSRNLAFNSVYREGKVTVYSIISTDKFTWIGTGDGLLRFSYADSTLNTFHKEDGLPCDEFNIGAVTNYGNGYLAFGGQGGVAYFHPDSVTMSNFNPEVEISRAVILGKRGKREQSVYSGATILLKPSDFLTNIYFASLDHTAPSKLHYRYKVNGSDWVEIGTQNYASFSNLQPGKYNIAINGSNSDRKWSSNIAYLTIKVERPWYISFWAYGIYSVLLLIFILVTIETRTRRLRLTNQVLKEKEASARQVAKQKDRLMLLHKNMTESMNYASRIQHALFPTANTFKRILPDSFVLHRPKDIISGDFYWLVELGPKVCVVAVDCTGHGVPGALMSVIAIELLKKTIVQEGYERPAEILEMIDISLHDLFKSDDSEEASNIADGMDMGVCMIDRETMMIEYAGAIHSLYYVKDGKFMEEKGDRMPVGMAGTIENFHYTNHYVEFSEDDVYYMASDGYADQFGGAQNKKYKNKRFKTFLKSIAGQDLDMQHLLLDNNFNKWRGNNEQVDDMMVIGFKPRFS